MAEQKKTKLLLELQMEELRATYGITDVGNAPKIPSHRPQDAGIAKLYEDIAEYEEEIKYFKQELEIITTTEIKNIVRVLNENLPNSESNYAQELQAVLVAGWTHLVQVKLTHPTEELTLIKETDFCDVVQKLDPHYDGDIEADIRAVLIQRWETIIEIKKEHIKEEKNEIKISGLKPDYAEKIYKRYHGIE